MRVLLLSLLFAKLWEELGSLPAVFPDGRPLHTKVDPWLLNDLVRSHLPKLNADRPFLSYLQLWISVMLAWWVVPLTMVLFWGRYLRRHEPMGTMLHVALLSVSLVAGIVLYRLAVATLRGASRMPFKWKKALGSRRGYQTAFSGVVVVILFGVVSWGEIRGVASDQWSKDPHIWVPKAAALTGFSSHLNIRDADVSQKKPNWSLKIEKDKDQEVVIGAQLDSANLRYASARGAFLADAHLEDADLRGADLNGTDLHNANLNGADLSDANLSDANLDHANLDHARLVGANLVGAELGYADLGYAHLDHADLGYAHLDHADLGYAHLSGADLNGADLNDARLNHADLSGADLSGAYLIYADLTYCNFRWIKNPNLPEVESGKGWDAAYFDAEALVALGLPPDHNEKLDEQRKKQTPPVEKKPE